MSNVNTSPEVVISGISAHVMSDVSKICVGYAQFDKVPVRFEIGHGVLIEYADALADNLNAVGQRWICDIELNRDNMIKYLNTLLAIRVATVNKDRARFTYEAKVPYPTVPAFFSVFLENVGIVRDNVLGIELYPTLTDTITYLNEEEFATFSNALARFDKAGFEFATRLPRDPKGSWDMMSMQMIDREIRHHDGQAHLVYALLTSLYSQQLVENVLLPRVSYGDTERYGGLVRELAKLKS